MSTQLNLNEFGTQGIPVGLSGWDVEHVLRPDCDLHDDLYVAAHGTGPIRSETEETKTFHGYRPEFGGAVTGNFIPIHTTFVDEYLLEGEIYHLLPNEDIMDLVVASISVLMVGPSMIIGAYLNDFPRGYFISIMIALAFFLMLFLNQPV